jgi:hypothetical protein
MSDVNCSTAREYPRRSFQARGSLGTLRSLSAFALLMVAATPLFGELKARAGCDAAQGRIVVDNLSRDHWLLVNVIVNGTYQYTASIQPRASQRVIGRMSLRTRRTSLWI